MNVPDRPTMPMSVLASGMVTAVGFNSSATCAAMRAGISGIRQTVFSDPESGKPISGGKVDLPHWWEGIGKMADLVAPAIMECLEASTAMAEKIPIFLGVAGPGSPHGVDGLEADLLDHIEFRLGLPHHPASKVLPFGQTSGCHGVEEARCVLAAGEAPFCVVAGVDCYLWQNVISAYIEQRRVMTETNSNGFFPGEAGTAVLVGVAATTAPRLIIAGVGAAQEDGTPTSERPLRAEGLTDAMRQALAQAGLTLTDVAYRITDLTGEHYKFKEAAFAAGRLDSGIRREHLELWHPVEFLGEVGAAIFPCMLGVALHAARNGYAPGRTVLCHAGNEAGERTAMVLTFTAGREAL